MNIFNSNSDVTIDEFINNNKITNKYSQNYVKNLYYDYDKKFTDVENENNLRNNYNAEYRNKIFTENTFNNEKEGLFNIISQLEKKNLSLEKELSKYNKINEENNLNLVNQIRCMQNEIEKLEQIINKYKIEHLDEHKLKKHYESIIESLKNKNEYITKLKDENKSYYIKEIGKIIENYEKEIKIIKNNLKSHPNEELPVYTCSKHSHSNNQHEEVINNSKLILKQIKKTETEIQKNTKQLKELEINSDRLTFIDKEMQIMQEIEYQTEELLKLKRKYNKIGR